MPNKKRKCVNCKEYGEVDKGIVKNSFYCSVDCMVEYGYKNRFKGAEKLRKQKKKAFFDNDLKTRKEAAIRACHAYIRKRDEHKGCVTCSRPLAGTKFDAGHFIKSTKSFTKFMEKNIHGQCVYCNQYRGGEEGIYRERIIAIYGQRTLDALMKCKDRKVKRTADDYKAIEEYFKAKLKQLEE